MQRMNNYWGKAVKKASKKAPAGRKTAAQAMRERATRPPSGTKSRLGGSSGGMRKTAPKAGQVSKRPGASRTSVSRAPGKGRRPMPARDRRMMNRRPGMR